MSYNRPIYIHIRDEKPNNTSGGTFLSGGWRTRDLNVVKSDVQALVSIENNQLTLMPGTYRCRIRCPALRVGGHAARLQNIDTNVTILNGSNAYQNLNNTGGQSDSWIIGTFRLKTKTKLEVQHSCYSTKTINGFGGSVLLATPVPEVYTEGELWRVGN